MQRLSRYMYRTGVGRAQLRVPLPRFMLMIRPDTKVIDEVRFPALKCAERPLTSASYGRIAVQVGIDIFFIIDRTKCCGWLKSAYAKKFDTKAVPNMHESRQSSALCLLKKRFVYVSGGKGRNCFECFDIEQNVWTKMP